MNRQQWCRSPRQRIWWAEEQVFEEDDLSIDWLDFELPEDTQMEMSSQQLDVPDWSLAE